MNELNIKLLNQIVEDVGEIKTDVAVIKRDLKHNQEINSKDHEVLQKDITELNQRLAVVEIHDMEKQSVLNQYQGAKKVITSVWKGIYGLIGAGLSGGLVYLAMKFWG